MKYQILDIDDGPSGQRCARLYGTTATSVHEDLLTGCLTDTPAPRWHLIPRLQHTDASGYQSTLDQATEPQEQTTTPSHETPLT